MSKKIYPFILLLFFSAFSYSQVKLYGLTQGSSEQKGTIVKFESANGSLEVIYTFRDIGNRALQNSNLVQLDDGKFYGTTPFGGTSGFGVLFSFDPINNEYTVLRDFEFDGRWPFGGITKVGNKLYGTLSGYIFSYDPATGNFNKYTVPDNIQTGVVKASDGKIYGTTLNGLIFSFDPVNEIVQTQSFPIVSESKGNLIQASNGLLYGTTFQGGSNNNGSIYSYDIFSNTLNIIYSLSGTGTDGGGTNGLLQAGNGILYGMTLGAGQYGKGVIFSFDLSNNQYTVLKNFDGANGDTPFGSLMQASDGKLYGVTRSGGTFGKGNVFSYDISSGNITTIKSLNEFDGFEPLGTLVQGQNGELFGMTAGGPSQYGMGTIYSIDPISNNYTLRTTLGAPNGYRPMGSFAKLNSGKLIATTVAGGNFGAGTIISIDTSDYSFSKLHDFNVTDGSTPHGDVVQASNGLMYGMTNDGGSFNRGTVFSFNPSNNSLTTLVNFNKLNGEFPQGSLIQASNGILYGLTPAGGPFAGQPGVGDGWGTLFSLDPSTNTHTILYPFNNGSEGVSPQGKLLQADDGKLYGLASKSLFSYNVATNNFSVVYSFPNSLMEIAFGSLIQATDGKLYGVGNNGQYNKGAIFSFDINTNTLQVIHSFDGINGRTPTGGLIQASDGKLYGMTSDGGVYDLGTVYSYDISTGIFTKENDFDGINGWHPNGLLIDPLIKDCPEFLVTIGDINEGVPGINSNTIYLGYAPYSSATLQANVSGGAGSYSYSWSTGATTSSITINPVVPTYYTVTVTDANSCKKTARIFINVIDIRCNDHKVSICHIPHSGMPNDICIDASSVQTHLASGCRLGSCSLTSSEIRISEILSEQEQKFGLTIAPNPSSTSFSLKISLQRISQNAIIKVVDMYGRIIDVKSSLYPNQVLKLGDDYAPGVYIVEFVDGKRKTNVKIVKLK